MSLSVITVTGMTCEHCEKAVRSEISAIPGVSQVDVDLASGEVKVMAEPAPEDGRDLRAAVEEAGLISSLTSALLIPWRGSLNTLPRFIQYHYGVSPWCGYAGCNVLYLRVSGDRKCNPFLHANS